MHRTNPTHTYPIMRYEFLEQTNFQLKYLFQFFQDYQSKFPPNHTPRWDGEEIRTWLHAEFGEPGSDNIRAFRYTHWGYESPHMSVIFRDAVDAAAFKIRFG